MSERQQIINHLDKIKKANEEFLSLVDSKSAELNDIRPSKMRYLPLYGAAIITSALTTSMLSYALPTTVGIVIFSTSTTWLVCNNANGPVHSQTFKEEINTLNEMKQKNIILKIYYMNLRKLIN